MTRRIMKPFQTCKACGYVSHNGYETNDRDGAMWIDANEKFIEIVGIASQTTRGKRVYLLGCPNCGTIKMDMQDG